MCLLFIIDEEFRIFKKCLLFIVDEEFGVNSYVYIVYH